jgi:hypothetical protein
VNKANDVLNKAVGAATPTANAIIQAGAKSLSSQTAPLQGLGKVIAGEASLGDAAKGIVHAEGAKYSAIGEVVSQVNASDKNIQVIAAESIGGNVGKTVMQISNGADRLNVEFAATALIAGGAILQGAPPDRVVAAPLAAALRAAEKQYFPDSKPIPEEVAAKFRGSYPSDVLANARYAIGSISISAPDLINAEQKAIFGYDNAVTVGRVTVFSKDPGNDFHWWAHELQHQVQYASWGFDEFAYQYMTSCHKVESEAEDKAQLLVPYAEPVKLQC